MTDGADGPTGNDDVVRAEGAADPSDPTLAVGVDIGGTFTDIVGFDAAAGRVVVAKVPSTPSNPADAVVAGLDGLFDETGYGPADVAFLAHGSTVTVNALIERTGAETAILLTEGFDAVPVARRGDRPQAEVTNPRYEPPAPLVPQRRVYEVPERVGADGEVVVPLDEAATIEVIDALREAGVESVAVCLLFSFLDDRHERRVAELFAERYPACSVSLSSAVSPRIREYPRLSTTTVAAYVDPILGRYLADLAARLERRGIAPSDLSMMLSHGGLTSFADAAAQPASTPLSGPAAGVQGARFAAELAGVDDVVTLDMGGTSCDIAIAPGGEPLITTAKELGGNPVTVPMVDVRAIGAGGGTIARVDHGRLVVGPDSAGADPGPVCYGRGGERVTVTDANLVLGRLSPDARLGGDLAVDRDAAEAAVREQVAEPLGLAVTAAAEGVLAVVNAEMKKELRLALTRAGHDPRRFALVAYGGAGPMHAPAIARELAIERVVVPPYPGLNSAVGLLSTDRKRLYERSRVEPLAAAAVEGSFAALVSEARTDLGETDAALTFERELELRYAGQSYELAVPVEPGDAVETIRERFDRAHEAAFGHAGDQPLETMTYRVAARQATDTLTGDVFADALDPDADGAPTTARPVCFDGDYVEAAVYDRERLPPGAVVDGPAVVEQADTTTVVDPHTRVAVDEFGNLVLTFDGGSSP